MSKTKETLSNLLTQMDILRAQIQNALEELEPKKEVKIKLEPENDSIKQEIQNSFNKVTSLIDTQFMLINMVTNAPETKINAAHKQTLLRDFTLQLQGLLKVQQELSGDITDSS